VLVTDGDTSICAVVLATTCAVVLAWLVASPTCPLVLATKLNPKP
jgi:hypothetical protein